MGRRRTPPPPKQPGDAWNVKLARLVEKKANGRTDEEIADAAGISSSHLSRLLSGQATDPKFSTILAILGAIKSSLSDLDRA